MFLTKAVEKKMRKTVKFPSPSGVLMFLTRMTEIIIAVLGGSVSVPFRGFDVSN